MDIWTTDKDWRMQHQLDRRAVKKNWLLASKSLRFIARNERLYGQLFFPSQSKNKTVILPSV